MLLNILDNLHRNSGIYTITNTIDERFYIGSTKSFKKRFRDHKSHLINKSHANKYLQAFVNKYGIDKLEFNLLFLCKNTCMVYNEKLWIDTLKPQFNLKKIINRPYFQDELRFNKEEFYKILHTVPDLLASIDLDTYYSVPYKHPIKKIKLVYQLPVGKQQTLSNNPKERRKELLNLIKEMRK